MRGFLLVMLMSITYASSTTSCPDSCVVCSDDAIICHKLSSIIGVPETTKVLMLTDGRINSVDNGTLSDLSNMTLLGLSNNIISNIRENAFQNLFDLRVLLLDHNLITGLSILDSTFSQLESLEILQLGNNAIRVIDGSWFRDMRNLRTLQLEGNLITGLDSGTFASSNLDNLETLDLSDNLIEYVARESFRALPRLRSLDLSRNSLRNAPDAFSYLSWLSALNLDLNQWNCTCELQELSSFLSSYVQAPDKVLYNGRQMVCLNAANPAVQTVLQLTEANCVPPNENITVLVKARDSISAQRYIRDISLAATFFFAGGVGLTVLVLYTIYLKLGLNKGSSPWRGRNWDDEVGTHSGAIQNRGAPEWGFTRDNKGQVLSISHPGHETKVMFPDSREQPDQRPWLRDRFPPGHAPARPEHHFVCHHCGPAGLTAAKTAGNWGADSSRGTIGRAAAKPSTHERVDLGEEGKRHVPQPTMKFSEDLRAQSQYQRRQGGQLSLNYPDDVFHHHWNSEGQGFTGEQQILSDIRHISPSHRNTSTLHSTVHSEMVTSGTHKDFVDSYSRYNGQTQSIHTPTDYLSIRCVHCLKEYEYRQAVGKDRSLGLETTTEGNAKKMFHREGILQLNPGLYKENSFNNMNNHTDVGGRGREHHARNPGINISPQRTVSFDLAGSDVHMINDQKKTSHKIKTSDHQKLKGKQRLTSTYNKPFKQGKGDHSRRHKHKVQSNGRLKVKINLNPFRKNRVNPKEYLSQQDVLMDHMNPERASAIAKENKLSSKGKKTSNKSGRDTRVLSGETEKEKNAKMSKKDRLLHKKKLGKSKHGTETSHEWSQQRIKSSRPKALRNSDKAKDSEREPCDTESEDHGMSEKGPQRKSTKKRREDNISVEDDVKECDTSPSISQEENKLKRRSKSSEQSEGGGDRELSIIQEPTAANGSDTLSVEGSTKQSKGDGEEPTSTDIQPSKEAVTDGIESMVVDTLTAEGETKQESSAPADSTHGGNADGLMMTEATGQSSQASGQPVLPQSDGAAEGVLPVDPVTLSDSPPVTGIFQPIATAGSELNNNPQDGENLSNNNSLNPSSSNPVLIQEYLPVTEGSPKRKIKLSLPERPNSRPPSALDKKIR